MGSGRSGRQIRARGKSDMSVEAVPGGKRRIDQVLDPRFVAGVEGLGLEELRSRRREAEAEEQRISYLRRVLQGRLDILRAELARRACGDDQGTTSLVASLPGILSDGKPGSFTAVLKIHMPESSSRHRRGIDRLVSDETVARLPDLEAEELTGAVQVLIRAEEAVSTNRRAVQHVVDLLRGELARRYRNGTASVAQLLE
jgi:hypothetical protein